MQSRIPGIAESPDFGSAQKRAKTMPMLKDITNNRYVYSNGNGNGRSLTFGDETSIEMVKNRQRKILRDINQLNDAIVEVNKSISALNSVDLIKVSRDKDDLNHEVESLQGEIMNLDLSYNKLINEYDMVERNESMFIDNLQLRYKIQVQEFINELDNRKLSKLDSLNKHVNEVSMSFKPHDSLILEIEELKRERDTQTQTLYCIDRENLIHCQSLQDNELKITLCDFQTEKNKSLNELEEENTKLKREKQNIIQNVKTPLVKALAKDEMELLQLQDEIDQMTNDIKSLQKDVLPPLAHRENEISRQLTQSNRDRESIQGQYDHLTALKRVKHGKLLDEQAMKQNLLRAIDKLK